ncbi:MAG: glycosyltransferase family 2 protein [Vicinamibacterales bacterium]|nr:glycosyltransferase family 2 protein [Vicinamibacterales bacterium]
MSSHSSTVDVSVIVLNFNGRQWLEPCLAATQSQLGAHGELILVDNASTDGSLDLVRERFPGVHVLSLDSNLGFAAGNNAGARIARGRCLAFLNNDTVPQPGWLDALKKPLLEDSGVALTTSRIVYLHDPSIIDSAGDGYLRAGGAFKRFHGAGFSLGDASGDVFGACGAACMIRRDVFAGLDGFDEDFFMVYEDVDLSYRARLRGHRCVYVANAIVHHAGSGTLRKTSATAVFYGQRNLEWTYLKNTPSSLLLRSFPSHMAYDAAALLKYASVGLLGPYLKGKWAALKGTPSVLRKRAAVQNGRITPANVLWQAMEKNWIRQKRSEKKFDFGLRGS